MNTIIEALLKKVVGPISKKTGVSPKVVTAVLTVGIPIIIKAFTKNKKK